MKRKVGCVASGLQWQSCLKLSTQWSGNSKACTEIFEFPICLFIILFLSGLSAYQTLNHIKNNMPRIRNKAKKGKQIYVFICI